MPAFINRKFKLIFQKTKFRDRPDFLELNGSAKTMKDTLCNYGSIITKVNLVYCPPHCA